MQKILTNSLVLIILGFSCGNQESRRLSLFGVWWGQGTNQPYFELWISEDNMALGYVGQPDILSLYEYVIDGNQISFYEKVGHDKRFSWTYTIEAVWSDSVLFSHANGNQKFLYYRIDERIPRISQVLEDNWVHLDSMRYRFNGHINERKN